MSHDSPLKVTVNDENERKRKAGEFFQIPWYWGAKGRGGLFLELKWPFFFTTLRRILSIVMSYPIFFIVLPLYSSSTVPIFSKT